MLNSKKIGDLSEKAEKVVGIALKNSDHLIRMINDLLDIDKIASGKLKFHFEKHDISELINAAIGANSAYAEEFRVSLVFPDKGEGIFAEVDGD